MSDSSQSQLCVVIARTRHKMMQIEIQEAAKQGAELIEVRLDFLSKAPDFKRLMANKPCPLVATVRRPAEGGRWAGSEDNRLVLLRQAVVAGFDWVDLETDIADSIPRFGKVKRIVSYHNFRGVPDDLEPLYAEMCEQDADVVKIAVTAQHPADNLRVLRLLEDSPKPTVAFCMGEMGFPSRLLGGRYQQPFAYCAFNKERGIAPGLPSFKEMKKLYRYQSIDADTPFCGVVGDPVAHSLSPIIHNRTFRKQKIPGVYAPVRVPRGELEDFLEAFGQLNVRGLSVTIPHKEEALELADRADQAAEQIGAANTLVHTPAGWIAYNTDAQAAADSLLANLPAREDGSRQTLEGKVVLLLGAGGVARALAYVLNQAGAILMISNRTRERADELAADFGGRSVEWNARNAVLAEVLINCTSVGMHPEVDESPIHNSFLKPGLFVFDTVYTPENTLLIKEASNRGCHVLTGVNMFIRQAAMQFTLFTGRDAPLELMENTVRRMLSPVQMDDDE